MRDPIESFSRNRCWTESGAHLFLKEPGGFWVCQVCGEVRGLSAWVQR